MSPSQKDTETHMRHLEREIESPAVPKLEESVWDFSCYPLLRDDGSTTITQYGDSLIAEKFSKLRIWHIIQSDTLFFAGEESATSVITPNTIRMSMILPKESNYLLIDSLEDNSYSAQGRIYSRYPIVEEGYTKHRFHNHTGTLIVASGDTLYNIYLTHSERMAKVGVLDYETCFSDISEDSLSSYRIDEYRWYSSNSPLPVALYVKRVEKNGTNPTFISMDKAFLPGKDEIKNIYGEENSQPVIIENILNQYFSAIQACHAGSHIKIMLPASPFDNPLSLILNLVDESGISYYHRTLICGEEVIMEVPIDQLMPRQYILFVNTSLSPDCGYKYVFIKS